MDFSERILNQIEKKNFIFLRNWIAENQSPDSAPGALRHWNPEFHSARDAEKILFLGLFKYPWEVWRIVHKIRQKAYSQRYSGRWKQVQDILEQVTSLRTFEDWYLSVQTMNTFFGNFLPECEKFLRRNSQRYLDNERKYRKPRRKVFRRGYDDKGFLRPPSEKISVFPDPNPGEDRRQKVNYSSLPNISEFY